MTGREKVLAAFRPEGTPQIGVVSCYDGIFTRDHWFDLTEVPWWYRNSGIVEQEVAWMRDFVGSSGLEWVMMHTPGFSREELKHHCYDERPNGVWRVDTLTGTEEKLIDPRPSGTNTSAVADKHCDLDALPTTKEEVDAAVPLPPQVDRDRFRREGRHDVPAAVQRTLEIATTGWVSSPLTGLYHQWGFEGMMLLLASKPDLARYAGERMLEVSKRAVSRMAAMGLDFAFIEEMFTDQISPTAFRELNVPLMRRLTDHVRACGMKSIYYYCGDLSDRMDLILETGAEGVHFEESKKGFSIDIDQVVQAVDGRAVVFGNLDAIGVLQNGSEEDLRDEIARQLATARCNGGRFVMSTGSPVTPDTPVERVRLYADLVRETGALTALSTTI